MRRDACRSRNPWRPSVPERCKQIDLGAWASEVVLHRRAGVSDDEAGAPASEFPDIANALRHKRRNADYQPRISAMPYRAVRLASSCISSFMPPRRRRAALPSRCRANSAQPRPLASGWVGVGRTGPSSA